MVSVRIETNDGSKTIGFITTIEELKSALKDLEEYGKKAFKNN